MDEELYVDRLYDILNESKMIFNQYIQTIPKFRFENFNYFKAIAELYYNYIMLKDSSETTDLNDDVINLVHNYFERLIINFYKEYGYDDLMYSAREAGLGYEIQENILFTIEKYKNIGCYCPNEEYDSFDYNINEYNRFSDSTQDSMQDFNIPISKFKKYDISETKKQNYKNEIQNVEERKVLTNNTRKIFIV